jgi:uncharacterized protein (TIGR02722 family)
MKHTLIIAALVAAPALTLITGCGTSVERLDATTVVDVSGAWNDTDSRLTAEEMVKDSLTRPWADDFLKKRGQIPVVKVRRITVRTQGEVINTAIITDKLISELINSGKATAVASDAESDQARAERGEQEKHASAETRKENFQETGSDFILVGSIESQDDQEGSKAVKAYAATFRLIDVTTQKITWQHTKDLKKLVKR